MASLLNFKAQVLISLQEEEYIRLEVEIQPKSQGIHCKQINVWLPKALSEQAPIAFVTSGTWNAGMGDEVTEDKIISNGDKKLVFRTYHFDDTTQGATAQGKAFTLGFRIERAVVREFNAIKIHIEELSRKAAETGFTSKKTLLTPKVTFIKPVIHSLTSHPKDKPEEHKTAFNMGEEIDLRWEGSLIETYDLYAQNKLVKSGIKGNSHTLKKGAGLYPQDFIVMLIGKSKLGTTTAQSLGLTITDHLVVGHRWDGAVTTDDVNIGKPDADGGWGATSAFMQMKDVNGTTGGINAGTNILFFTHKWGVASTEAMRIAAIGNVGIGTKEPKSKLSVSRPKAEGWIAADFGNNVEGEGHVVMGTFGDKKAAIGAHLWKDGTWHWSDLMINHHGSGNVLINTHGGKVGIGTTTPFSHLSIGSGDENRVIALMEGADGAGLWGLGKYGSPPRLSLVAEGEEVLKVVNGKGRFDRVQFHSKVYFNEDVSLGSNTKKVDLKINGHLWIKPGNDNRIFVFNRGGIGGQWASLDAEPLSDQRLKTNIAELAHPLEKLTALNGVSFEWNEDGLASFTKDVEKTVRSATGTPEDDQEVWAEEKQKIRDEKAGAHLGFIAQDVEQVFPEWVGTNDDGYKTLDTSEMLPLLVEAIKAQQQQIDALRREVVALKGMGVPTNGAA